MEIYSLKNIEIALLNSPLLLNLKSEKQKLLLLEKHYFVINKIISNNLKLDNPLYFFTNINSLTFKKYLGDRYYVNVLKNLKEVGVIIINEAYSGNKFSKSFRIPKSIIKKYPVTKIEVKSIRFNSKLKTYIKQEFEEINKDPLFHKILVNTSKLKFIPEFTHYIPIPKIKGFLETNYGEIPLYDDNSSQILRYNEFSEALKRFNKMESIENIYLDNIFYKPSRVESGRIYHMVASIPRLVRQCLRTKTNDLIYEIDMSSAQPSLLILEYLKQFKLNTENICVEEEKEAEKCLKLLLKGELYKHIQNSSHFFKNLSYEDLKKSVLTTLNAKKNNSIYNKELLRIFPFFMRWVNNIKKNESHNKISFIGQNAESNIFVYVYSEIKLDIFALIIHDCILTTFEYTNDIKHKLIERVKFLYPEVLNNKNDLSKLFKVGIVSLKDEELPSYLQNQFSNDI